MEETKHQLGYKRGAGKHQREQFERRIREYNLNPTTCLECNEPLPYPKNGQKKKFCNNSCAATFNNKRRRSRTKEELLLAEPKKISCIVCGVEVETVNKHTASIKCEACKSASFSTLTCEGCGIQFTTARAQQRFCTPSCAKSHRVITQEMRERFSSGGRKSAHSQSKNRRSKNEKLFAKMCETYFNDVETNQPIFNGWDADVIIHDISVAVLWNGKWHYEKITERHSVKQVQNRDKIKIKEIASMGYTPHIIKDLSGHDPNFVQKEFEKFIAEYTTGEVAGLITQCPL